LSKMSDKLGITIKSARMEKHLTQKQLANRLSITPHYLMSIENKKQIPSGNLLFQIIRELEISADMIFYPEQRLECEIVNRLHTLLGRFEEHDIELIIAMLQTLLQAKCAEGGNLQCRIKCPNM